jgi:predicted N-acetyltransferase YhbS
MSIRITRASPKDADTIRALHTLCFPRDEHEDYTKGLWWLAHDGEQPVGFIGAKQTAAADDGTPAAYFSRVGVLDSHRGKRLAQRLVRVMERGLRNAGIGVCVSTTYCNPASGNNFIRCGYRMFTPATPWGADGTVYWWRTL